MEDWKTYVGYPIFFINNVKKTQVFKRDVNTPFEKPLKISFGSGNP
jgi:hypothetical protein